MNWVLHGSIKRENLSAPLHLPQAPAPPPPAAAVYDFSLQNKISPSILLIILILAVIFFVSGILHLLVRYLLRPTSREPEEPENATAFQGRLQQLFHLHDAGVDQSYIDTLPVFLYRAIIGLRDPFDCAVCLSEFEADNKLRLLPKCSHAFHLECIDTWLLSHSTCPLCRSSLQPDLPPYSSCSPAVLLLESGSESSREIAAERGESGPNARSGLLGEDDSEISHKTEEIRPNEEVGIAVSDASEAKTAPVKLGKFRRVEVSGALHEGRASSSGSITDLDQRRCYSMGSYEYVMDERCLLQVAIRPPKKKPRVKNPGQQVAMSECDCYSRRGEFRGFDQSEIANGSSGFHQKESFSVSKTWLRLKNNKPVAEDSSRRASSFRLSLGRDRRDESKVNGGVSPATMSEHSVDWDVEVGSCNNRLSSRTDEAPSFARRSLLWILGWQNR